MSASAVTLDSLADQLEAEGLDDDAARLREAASDIEATEKPPGLFQRVTSRLREQASHHWKNVVGEVRESKEVWDILTRKLRSGEELTPAERDAVKSQMLDALRVVPASMLLAANWTLPVPGTSVLTPWLLKKAGLLPSRWREAHALDVLQKEAAHLRAIGHIDQADKVLQVMAELEAQAAQREAIERKCALLTHWDANDNGVWDADEVDAYRVCVENTRAHRARDSHRKSWYLQHHDHVFGPVRLDELLQTEGVHEGRPMVCFDGTGWVSWADLLRTDGGLSVKVGQA
jgi:hypothetical protein